jgi:hypothetical membrane protein
MFQFLTNSTFVGLFIAFFAMFGWYIVEMICFCILSIPDLLHISINILSATNCVFSKQRIFCINSKLMIFFFSHMNSSMAAKELQRVAVLNVLGKPVKNFKAPADHGECSDKLKTLS